MPVCVCVRTGVSVKATMSLSPWDLGAEISFDFSLYRPRRDSYVCATDDGTTQVTRGRRNASYRRATKRSSTSTPTPATSPDYATSGLQETGSSFAGDDEEVERLKLPPVRKKRARSYRAAVRHATGEEELSTVDEGLAPPPADKGPEETPAADDEESATPPPSPMIATPLIGRHRSTKNLLVLSVGFVLKVFDRI